MNKQPFIKTLIICLIFAFFISLLSLFILGKIAEESANNARQEFVTFMAKRIENHNKEKSIENFDLFEIRPLRSPKRPPPLSRKMGPERERKSPPPRGHKNEIKFWLTTIEGDIISSTSNRELPLEWRDIPKAQEFDVVKIWNHFFLVSPSVLSIKLKTNPTTYLIASEERTFFDRPLFLTQIILSFLTVSSSLILAVVLISLYLRKKSLEAQIVIEKISKGDLKARFSIGQLDDKSGLIQGFNQMADEIERLVTRLKETEMARTNLMQELGHDLRTPLTSLNSASQILKEHYKAIPDDQRDKLLNMIQSDVNYFKDLIEKLIIIASLDTHAHKRPNETLSLENILNEEVESRKNTQSHIKWEFNSNLSEHESLIHADIIHISRLIKNALDNANKYASSSVSITLKKEDQFFNIIVQDDGAGPDQKSISLFGTRREKREKTPANDNYSLGLGSVIMKTIADIYQGNVELKKAPEGGAILLIKLKA